MTTRREMLKKTASVAATTALPVGVLAAPQLGVPQGARNEFPMFVVPAGVVPEDGVYECRPGKIWRRSGNAPSHIVVIRRQGADDS